MFKAKYFNKFKSSPPFDKCSSKDTNKLAEQLSQALDSLNSRPSSVGVAGVATSARTKNDTPQTPQNVDYATTRTRTSVERITDSPKDVDVASAPRERNTPQHVDDTSAGGENSESTAGPSRANETPVSTKQPLREKRGLYFHQRTKIRRRNPRKRTSCSDHVTSVLLAVSESKTLSTLIQIFFGGYKYDAHFLLHSNFLTSWRTCCTLLTYNVGLLSLYVEFKFRRIKILLTSSVRRRY